MSDAMTVGKRLVELCSGEHWEQAMDELYAEDATHVEAMDMGKGREASGKATLTEMCREWIASNDVHSCEIGGPMPNGDRFVLTMKIDVTPKAGPMAGQRHVMEEAALYTLDGGKISRVEFFYPTDPTAM